MKERDHLGDQDIGGRIKLILFLKKESESEYWVRLARNLVTVTCVDAVIKPVP
jgi:hypothetical protein